MIDTASENGLEIQIDRYTSGCFLRPYLAGMTFRDRRASKNVRIINEGKVVFGPEIIPEGRGMGGMN